MTDPRPYRVVAVLDGKGDIVPGIVKGWAHTLDGTKEMLRACSIRPPAHQGAVHLNMDALRTGGISVPSDESTVDTVTPCFFLNSGDITNLTKQSADWSENSNKGLMTWRPGDEEVAAVEAAVRKTDVRYKDIKVTSVVKVSKTKVWVYTAGSELRIAGMHETSTTPQAIVHTGIVKSTSSSSAQSVR